MHEVSGVCVWREAKGSQPHGGVSEGSVCNLQKTHAIDRHTIVSTRPLIAMDAEEHMFGREEGKGCQMSAMCRHMVPTS